MSKKIYRLASILLGLALSGFIFEADTAEAKILDIFSFDSPNLPEPYASEFPQNNIIGWNPCEGGIRSNVTAEGCFKVNSSVDAQSFWYGEGCLNTGVCSEGAKYYAHGKPPESDNGLRVTSNNPFLYNDTKTDDDFGGMQYIYAENYDYEYSGSETKMTPNGGNSTQKYYWIVLPDQAYSNGFGDTYIATFENLSEPVYFIVFDTHQCGHQSEDYCGQANSNPDGVQIGKQFLGAFTKDGSFQEAANIAGKLTSFCRIKGTGEVTASSNTDNTVIRTSEGTTSSSNSSSSGGGNCNFTKYNYSDDELRKLAAVAATENGGTIESLKHEMSLMANLFESGRGKNYSSVLDYVINGGWFGSSKGSISGDSASAEQLEAARDVFNNGNRTLPPEVDEHDCIDCGSYGFDITSIEVSGKTITDSSGLLKAENYVKNETILHNKYGATYTFYTWADPSNPVRSDPMGYTNSSISCDPNNTCTGGNSQALSVVSAIIELANKNGSEYTWGGGHSGDASVFDNMLNNNAPINVDCTGFASLVMYKTYGQMTTFTSSSIFSDPMYKEVPKTEARPGDIFAYNPSTGADSGHGGVVIEVNNGEVTKIAETGGMEGRSGRNNNIGYSSTGDYTIGVINSSAGHIFRWNGPENGSESISGSCPSICGDEEGALHSGGFKDVSEADRVIMAPYRELYNHSELWGEYNLAGGPDNCVSFSKYFLTKYTTIDYHGEAFGDGGAFARGFYNGFHGNYPELTISDKPSAYSIASCGDESYSGGNYSHTFVVLGVDESSDKMIVGEAGYGSGIGFTTAKEFSLTNPSDSKHNGVDMSCTYVNINNYITGL